MDWEERIKKIENHEDVKELNLTELAEEKPFEASNKLTKQLDTEKNPDLRYHGSFDNNEKLGFITYYRKRVNYVEKSDYSDYDYRYASNDKDFIEKKNEKNSALKYENLSYEGFGTTSNVFLGLSHDEKVKYLNNIKYIKARMDLGDAEGISYSYGESDSLKDTLKTGSSKINFRDLDLINLNLKNHGFGELGINYHFDYTKQGMNSIIKVEIEKKALKESEELKKLKSERDSLIKTEKKKFGKIKTESLKYDLNDDKNIKKEDKTFQVFSYYDDVMKASSETYDKLLQDFKTANQDYSEKFGEEKIHNAPKYLHALIFKEDEINDRIEKEKEKLKFFEKLEECELDDDKIELEYQNYNEILKGYTGKTLDKWGNSNAYVENDLYADIRKTKKKIATLNCMESGKVCFAKFLNNKSGEMNAVDLNNMAIFLNQAISRDMGDIKDKSLGFTNSTNQVDKFVNKSQNLVDKYYLALHADELIEMLNSIDLEKMEKNGAKIPVNIKNSFLTNREIIIQNLTICKANKPFMMDDFIKTEMNANAFSVKFDVDDPKTLVTLSKINKAFEKNPNYKLDGLENNKAFRAFVKLGADRLAYRAKCELETAEILLSECKNDDGNYVDKNNLVFKDEKGKEVKLATEEGRKKALTILLAKDEKTTLQIYDSTNPYFSCDVRNDGNMGWTKYKAQIDCDYKSLNLGELPKEPSTAKKIWHWIKRNIFRSAEGVKEVEEYNKAKAELEDVKNQIEAAAKDEMKSLEDFTDVNQKELLAEKERLINKFNDLERSKVIQEMKEWEKMPAKEKIAHLNDYIKWKEIKEKWDNAPVEDRQKTRITTARSKDMLIERGVRKKIAEAKRFREDVAAQKEESIKVFKKDDGTMTKLFEKGIKEALEKLSDNSDELKNKSGSMQEKGFAENSGGSSYFGPSEHSRDVEMGYETLFNKQLYNDLDNLQPGILFKLYEYTVTAQKYINSNLAEAGKGVVNGACMDYLNERLSGYFNGIDIPKNAENREELISERYKPIGEMLSERVGEMVKFYKNAIESSLQKIQDKIPNAAKEYDDKIADCKVKIKSDKSDKNLKELDRLQKKAKVIQKLKEVNSVERLEEAFKTVGNTMYSGGYEIEINLIDDLDNFAYLYVQKPVFEQRAKETNQNSNEYVPGL